MQRFVCIARVQPYASGFWRRAQPVPSTAVWIARAKGLTTPACETAAPPLPQAVDSHLSIGELRYPKRSVNLAPTAHAVTWFVDKGIGAEIGERIAVWMGQLPS